jgi:hypothetical protein
LSVRRIEHALARLAVASGVFTVPRDQDERFQKIRLREAYLKRSPQSRVQDSPARPPVMSLPERTS